MKKIFCVLFTSILLVSCGGESSSNSNATTSNPKNNISGTVDIDDSATIPLFRDAATSSGIYVHNNSDANINNISYTLETNLPSFTLASAKMALAGKACNSIYAHGSCFLGFTIPVTLRDDISGAVLIKGSYQQNNHTYHFQQVLSVQTVDTGEKGVYFTSAVSSEGPQNQDSFTTLYTYGSGVSSTIYHVDNLSSSFPQIAQIEHGDISNSNFAARTVAAIEVKTKDTADSFLDNLTITSHDESGEYISSQKIKVSNSQVISELKAGLTPIIIAGESSTIFIHNIGINKVTIDSIAAMSSSIQLNALAGDVCSSPTTLGATDICNLKYSVASGATTGSASIVIRYHGIDNTPGSLIIPVEWRSSEDEEKIVQRVDNPIYMLTNSNQTQTITVTNLGKYELTDLWFSNPSASGLSSQLSQGTCTDSLKSGSSCQYHLLLNSSKVVANQPLSLKLSGKYTDSAGKIHDYSQSTETSYTSLAVTSQLLLSPHDTDPIKIINNGVESGEREIQLTNISSTPAEIKSIGLINHPSSMVENGDCAGIKTLAANASCNAMIKLNPTTMVESGIANYQVLLNNGETLLTNIPYSVASYNPNLDIGFDMQVSGQSSGSGLSGKPIIFSGGNSDKKTLDFVYTNNQSTPLHITGIDLSGIDSAAWEINYSASKSCFNNGAEHTPNIELLKGDSCVVELENVLAKSSKLGTEFGTVYTTNIGIPKLLVLDGYQVIEIAPHWNSQNQIYVRNTQAVVTNSAGIIHNGSSYEALVITNTLSGYSQDYGQITVNSVFNDYVSGTTKHNCKISHADDMTKQACSFTANGSQSETYPLDLHLISPEGTAIPVTFTTENSYPQLVFYNAMDEAVVQPFIGDYLYMAPDDLPVIFKCKLTEGGAYDPDYCVNTAENVGTASNTSKDIVFYYNQYAYISGSGGLYKCEFNNSNGDLVNCASISASPNLINSPTGLAVNLAKNQLYIAELGSNMLTSCDIALDNGTLSNCKDVSLGSSYNYGVTYDSTQNIVWVNGSNNNGISRCNVDKETGKVIASSCLVVDKTDVGYNEFSNSVVRYGYLYHGLDIYYSNFGVIGS